MNNRDAEQKCKAAANRFRKIQREPAGRILPTLPRAHATPQSNASFETKHRPPAAFPELLSFTKRRSTNVILREQNRASSLTVVVAVAFGQYWARSSFSPLPLCPDKDLSDPCTLIWLSPAVPCSLCSCAMAPMLKAAKAIATAAATFASIDNFILRITP